MGIEIDAARYIEIETVTRRLRDSAVTEFAALSGASELPDAAGVYAIFHKGSGEVFYVGKTTNLRQRLYNNHLMGPLSNARLKKYLIDDPEKGAVTDKETAKQYIRSYCAFVYILEPDMRARGHLEGLVSFLTDCTYVDKEH